MQGHTTAIQRNKPSAPMRWLHSQGLLSGRTLDFGCGRGADADAFGMEAYDPHWKPDVPQGPYDTITCNYVLNVVTEETQDQIIGQIKDLLSPTGNAYLTVRRDLPQGGQKGRGVWQRFVELDLPVIKKTSGFAIYQISVPDRSTRTRPPDQAE